MSQDFIHEAAASLMRMFEQKAFPSTVAFTILRRKAGDDKPMHRWSLGNQLIALCLGRTEDARTFLQWKAVGRYPKKGSSAFRILAPCTRKIELESDEQGSARSGIRLLGFRPLSVFAVEVTEGASLPVFDYAPPQLPPLWRAAEKLGIDVSFAPFDGRALGWFRPEGNRILLSAADAAVYYHELAHAVHHTFEKLRPGILQRAEITAELASAVLCELTGVSGYEQQTYAYIQHFAAEKDDKSVLQAMLGVLTDVEKIVGLIWDAATETEVSKEAAVASKSA